jgi:hypothetical protein
MTETQHVVLTDSRLPTDRFILDGIDVTREPMFTVSEVAKVFFARSPHWIRWRERKDYFVLDGERVGGQRTDEGARRYNLADIEKMAHALAEKGAINGAQLTNALLLVQTEARVWGYIQ